MTKGSVFMQGDFFQTILIPCVLGALLVWRWPRRWSCGLIKPKSERTRTGVRISLLVLAAVLLLSIFFVTICTTASGESAQQEYHFVDVISQAVAWGLMLVPLLVGLKVEGSGWGDLGYRRHHLFSALVLGLLIGVVFLAGASKIRHVLMVFSARGAFATLQFLVVGFAEETLFRGYVQARWVAAWGWWPGFLLASLVMSLFHLPLLFLGQGLPWTSALLEVLHLLPLSLLMGYIMRKSGNIAAPAVVHLWLNLIEAL